MGNIETKQTSSEYWKTEDFRWQKITEMIESQKHEPANREFYDLSRTDKYNLSTSPDEERDYQTNLFIEFEQFDDCKVKIERKIQRGLTTIRDAIFSNSEGKEIFKLSEIIPEDYIVVEGEYIGKDFINPTHKLIALQYGFLESVGGRLCFLHEVGHAIDYVKKPLDRKEFINQLKGLDDSERENNAWEYSKQILEKMKQKGLDFFPDWFEKYELEKWIEFCKKHHNYPKIKR